MGSSVVPPLGCVGGRPEAPPPPKLWLSFGQGVECRGEHRAKAAARGGATTLAHLAAPRGRAGSACLRGAVRGGAAPHTMLTLADCGMVADTGGGPDTPPRQSWKEMTVEPTQRKNEIQPKATAAGSSRQRAGGRQTAGSHTILIVSSSNRLRTAAATGCGAAGAQAGATGLGRNPMGVRRAHRWPSCRWWRSRWRGCWTRRRPPPARRSSRWRRAQTTRCRGPAPRTQVGRVGSVCVCEGGGG